MKRTYSKAVAVRGYTARKVLLTVALVLATYLALVPIMHRFAE